MGAIEDLASMAESYGYQMRTRLWFRKDVWWADILVLDQDGTRAAYQKEKANRPSRHMEWVAMRTLEELRRHHKAKWRGMAPAWPD